MSNKAILDVEIDDSAFSEFKRKFDEYGAALKTLPAQWAASNTAIATTRTAFEKAATDLVRAGDRAQGLAKAAGDAGKIADVAAATWAGMATSGKLFSGHIVHATQHLAHWTKLTAVFSGLLGAGGLFGINRMAAGVAGQRTSATGLGISYGEQASFLTNFGRLGNAEGILQGFSEAETDASKKYALRQYLGHTESGDPAKDFAEGLGRFKEFVDKTPRELLEPMLQARGYDKLGIGREQANIVRGMSREEVAQLRGGYKGDLASRLGLNDTDAKKWTEFTTQMERADREIQTEFAKGAINLTPSLTHLSDSFVKLIDHMLVDGGPIAGFIDKAGKGLDRFADSVDSGDFQRSVSNFVRDCGDSVKLFENFVSSAPGGVAVLLGTGLAARFGGGAAVAAGAALARSSTLGVLARGAGVVLGPAGAIAAGGLAASSSPTNESIPESERQRRFHQGAYGRPEFAEHRHRFGHPHAKGAKGALRYFNEGGEGPFPETSQGLNVPMSGGPANLGIPSFARLSSAEPHPLDVIHGTTQGVDKRLLNAVAAGAADLPPGYKVKVFSGFRSGDPGAHGRGQAIDVEIVDPKGNVIPSRGEDKTGMYERLARHTYAEMRARYPDLAENKFAWGGSFGTQKGGGGVSDLMHFDIMKRRGGVRAGHFPQIQQLGPLPLHERTLGHYIGHDKQSRRASFGHPHVVGHHPATIGRAQKTLTIEDHTGGLVTVVPH